MLLRTLLCVLCLFAVCTLHASAVDAEPIVFERHLAPIIQAQCVECHNSKTHKGELDLSTRAGVLKGGESGATVVPGKLDDSVLYTMLHEGLMPPPGKPRLKPEQVELFATWIKSGANFAESTASAPPPVEQLSQHDILPILLVRCTVCHGRRTQEAGLDLRTKATMLKGGK
ncbi:MAG: hypothetical protein JNM18_23875, partial [Planctomycetaceae bacterium]|nr:hypothetical protein [Planctomycetaceae bacterium]